VPGFTPQVLAFRLLKSGDRDWVLLIVAAIIRGPGVGLLGFGGSAAALCRSLFLGSG